MLVVFINFTTAIKQGDQLAQKGNRLEDTIYTVTACQQRREMCQKSITAQTELLTCLCLEKYLLLVLVF